MTILLRLGIICAVLGAWFLIGGLILFAAPPGIPWFAKAGVLLLPLTLTFIAAQVILET